MKKDRTLLIHIAALIWIVLIAGITFAVDWGVSGSPTNSTTYSNVLSALRARDESVAKADYSADTNVPDGFIRYNGTTKHFEVKSGASWTDVLTDYTNHLANTSNPHTVTAAQVGNTTAQWNANKLQGSALTVTSVGDNEVVAYDSGTSSWINQTATEAGLASSSDLSTHIANTSNPHATTATQVGALAAANNLSDLGTVATARTNLGLGSLATLSTVNNSQWSGTSLAVANGGTAGTTAATARSNLSAAASGANSDITSLTNIPLIEDNATMTVGTTNGNNLILKSFDVNRLELDTSNNFFPVTAGGINLGTDSKYFNGVTAATFAAPTTAHLAISAPGSGKEIRFSVGGTHYWSIGSAKITPTT